MPEPDFMALYAYTPEPPKKAPVIKVSCGIGDTDGFPAFDVDSEQYAAKDDSKWGFLITGGAEFHMPLTVFQVTPDGLADKGGICLGDIILEINEEDATQLTLSEAHEKINASGKKIQFLVKSMEDEEPMEGYEPGEERCIVLRVPKPPPPPKVSTIEKRLQELHRKLSEIAEIPKILSSTLATVSQTFDKLTNSSLTASPPTFNAHCEQKRKMSYDEDVYDYELSDDNDAFKPSDEEEEFNVKRAYLQLKRYAARQRKSKDVTPESDYASETNFQTHETNDWQAIDNTLNGKLANESIDNKDSMDEDEDDDDDEKSCDMYEEFTLSLFNKSHHNGHESESDIEEYDIENDDKPDDDDDDIADGDDDASDDDDDDFLTTTLTWNLSNKSKLQRNDSRNSNNSSNTDDNYEDIDDNANKSLNVQQHSYLGEGNILKQIQQIKGNTPEKDQKVDKLERSWPWADREKIIYKQSTCHLVPHKPLGLIEQRIQLLAKRNLLEHLNKTTKNPQ